MRAVPKLSKGWILAAIILPSLEFCTVAAPWNGFERTNFTFEGRGAFVTRPKQAAPGNPWIWRTSFPDFHAEVDRGLLERGFHVAHVDVVSMLGCDASLDIMDRFYARMTNEFQLSGRPAIEGVSRGGLHAYRYAARHPDRISAIYCDTPVMNLTSWPLGWPGARNETRDALHHYGLTNDSQLVTFRGNPIDLLAPIAKARIPIRHVISLTDRVVPPEQNTLEARRRLKALGHDMELVEVPQGTPQSNGHHFPLPAIDESVDFIVKHAGAGAP